MKSTLVSKDNTSAKLTMEFTAEEFEAAVNNVYKKNRNQFVIDGFRKGKAPRSIIERHYGEGIFFEDAINDLFNENYPNAVSELDIEVIDRPSVDFSEIGKGLPLTMNIDVLTFPVLEVNSEDYFDVEIDQIDSKISDEDVDYEIENLRKKNARMELVDRPVEDGDTILLDYAGTVDGVAFDGGTAERYELKIGSGSFIPGFEDQLVGVSKGEEKDVVVTFPENYQEASLAGKEAVFHCLVHEIKEEQLPELDDEFVKDVSEFDTLDELKEDTRNNLQKERDAWAAGQAKDALVDKIAEKIDYTLPEVMVQDEIDMLLNEYNQQLMGSGLNLDTYMKYLNKTMDDMKQDVRPDAEKRLKGRIVVRSIAEKEGVEIGQEDIDAEIKRMAEMYQMDEESIRRIFGEGLEGQMKKDLIVRKCIDMLYDHAKITKVDPPQPSGDFVMPEDREEAAEAEAEEAEAAEEE